MIKKDFLLWVFVIIGILINPNPAISEPSKNVSPSPPSENISRLVDNYMQSQNVETYNEFIKAFKNVLLYAQTAKLPAAAILANNPSLSQIGTKVIDISGGRLWTFSKANNGNEAVVQWLETKSRVVKVKRRTKVVTEAASRIDTINLPSAFIPREGKIVAPKDSAKLLVICGDKANGAIWLKAYRSVDGHFREASQFFSAVPSFLLDDVSGWVSFHGSDMIFTVSPISTQTVSGGNMILPESERSTYKFCLRISQAGYVLESGIADMAPYSVLSQFLQNIKAGRTDMAKSCLLDGKLLSIPKYIGLNSNHGTNFKVTQMAAAPSGIYRFRVLTGLKDDLIFDVASLKVPVSKGEVPRYDWLIKAIFVAPTDKFLQTIANNLPNLGEVHETAATISPQAVSVKGIKPQQ